MRRYNGHAEAATPSYVSRQVSLESAAPKKKRTYTEKDIDDEETEDDEDDEVVEVQMKVDPTLLYCICKQPQYGEMVGCDSCSGWFHFNCVGLKTKPKKVNICMHSWRILGMVLCKLHCRSNVLIQKVDIFKKSAHNIIKKFGFSKRKTRNLVVWYNASIKLPCKKFLPSQRLEKWSN